MTDHKSSLDFARWLEAKQDKEAPGGEEADAAGSSACTDPGCIDPSHIHEHEHEHEHDQGACDEPNCKDPSHSHSHSHEHAHADRQQTTAAKRFGIRTFVYTQRRPFASARFHALVHAMPLTLSALPAALKAAEAEASGAASAAAASDAGAPFEGLLRSKGFIWLDCSHSVAYYWSQAGKYVRMEEMGRWWAAVPAEARPPAHQGSILEDFEGEWGDRRQELVFIGMDLPEAAIRSALDQCVLDDAEMDALRVRHGRDTAL